MYTLIEYPMGVIVEAAVLSMEPGRLRVAVAGGSDALEFTASGLQWVTEEGRNVAVAFLQYDTGEAVAGFPHGPALAARCAGSWAAEGQL